MNCQSCNTGIDYLYLTNCEHCGSEVERANLNVPPAESDSPEKSLTWGQGLINVTYLFAVAIVGLTAGAVVLYFLGAMIYIAFFSGGGGNPGDSCARGTAAAVLSILSGAFLGTVGGSVFAIKNLPCKAIN
jgi:hypothetical protein